MPIATRSWVGSNDASRWPFAAACSQLNCNFTVCCGSVEEGEVILASHEQHGPCPMGTLGPGERMTAGKSLRQQQWDILDVYVLTATDKTLSDADTLVANGKCQGVAECIFLMDAPFWESTAAVLQEANKRLRISQGREEFSETPGYHYPHPVATIQARIKADAERATRKVPEARVHVNPLDEKVLALGVPKIQRVVTALNMDFEPEMLAETYGIPLAVIKRIAAQPDRFVKPTD